VAGSSLGGGPKRRAAKLKSGDSRMRTLRNVTFAVLALLGASVPVAAYTGYYAPACGWGTAWSLSGVHYQYLCF
jgi:hypothetical protein